MGGGITERHIHILQRLGSRLRHEEIGEAEGEEAECSEEDVGAPFDGGEHVGSDEADDAVVCVNRYVSKEHIKKRAYKLHIQVVEVVIEIAFERMASVKISEGKTHPIGADRSGQKCLPFLWVQGLTE